MRSFRGASAGDARPLVKPQGESETLAQLTSNSTLSANKKWVSRIEIWLTHLIIQTTD